MTIDSNFIACFKRDAPHAFTRNAPFTPHAVFCDGQIRLMRPNAPGEKVLTWDTYIHRQFTQTVQWYFNQGVQCFIMAFDDYDYVPCAKSMTQVKRRRHLPPFTVSDRDPLPPVCPDGEYWQRCISNRVFKAKVIELIKMCLPKTLNFLNDTQSLVIDYRGAPTIYRRSSEPEPFPGMGGMGEADIKFVRYAQVFPDLQIDSVDGDSIPIALLMYQGGFQGKISIRRMLTKVDDDKTAKAKRKRQDDPAPADPPAEKQSTPRRVYEFVDIGALYGTLITQVFAQCTDRVRMATHAGHEISLLIGLIGLAGTDYTRGLPFLSGTTLYEQLPNIWMKLATCYDPGARLFSPERVLNKVVARLYQHKYRNHTTEGPYEHILREIRGSKLSQKTKDAFAPPQTVQCTVRNINWLLRYWSEQQFPDPIAPEWGYCKRRGVVGFDD